MTMRPQHALALVPLLLVLGWLLVEDADAQVIKRAGVTADSVRNLLAPPSTTWSGSNTRAGEILCAPGYSSGFYDARSGTQASCGTQSGALQAGAGTRDRYTFHGGTGVIGRGLANTTGAGSFYTPAVMTEGNPMLEISVKTPDHTNLNWFVGLRSTAAGVADCQGNWSAAKEGAFFRMAGGTVSDGGTAPDPTFQACVYDGSSGAETCQTLSDPGDDEVYNLRIEMTCNADGTGCTAAKFYVDDVLAYSASSNLPNTQTLLAHLCYDNVSNSGAEYMWWSALRLTWTI